MKIDPHRLNQLIYWISERESVRVNREAGCPAPWTDDPILQAHHFCNVHREDDRGTKEIHAAAKRCSLEIDELPAFYTAARMFNNAKSTELYWNEGVDALKALRDAGGKIFHVAYVVSTCGVSMDKIDYVHEVVQSVSGLDFPPQPTCAQVFRTLRTVSGIGSFIGGQIVADLKYTRFLGGAADWATFAVMGPGSKKGLDILMGGGTTERNFMERLMALRSALGEAVPPMHNQDLQNCLCEFSKFIRYLDNTRGRRRMYHARS